jgi:hypothetical protein
MLFEVLDVKGIAYSDDSGRRQVIEKKKFIDKKMIDSGFFTLEGIDYLIGKKRLSEVKGTKKGKVKMDDLNKLTKDDLIVKANGIGLSDGRNLAVLSKSELVNLIQGKTKASNKKMVKGEQK